MFGIERRNMLLSILAQKKSLLVNEMAAHFNVTEETIRRDLKELESSGQLIRIHGGAVLSEDTNLEPSFEIREVINVPAKNLIAINAAKMINDGDTIILDASTSSLHVAMNIKDKKGLTVITNALKVILELKDCKDVTILSTGGILRLNSLSFVGRSAEKSLENYYASKLFFSCKGFSPERGLTDSNEQESELRKKMLTCCEKAIFLCDSTKFNQAGYVTTASLNDIDILISDSTLPEDWAQKINEAGITYIKA